MTTVSKTIHIDLLRHGQPEGGDVLRGRIDHPLADAGWQQMQEAVDQLSTSPWTGIITSPLQRCRAFAERLSENQSVNLQVDERWVEIDYGDWDGLPLQRWQEVAATQFREFRHDLSRLVPPNGEPYLSFRDRVLEAWQELQRLDDGSHVLLITHGGVLRVILPTVLGMPLNDTRSLHIPFACISRVQLQLSGGKLAASLLFHNASEKLPP